MTEREPEYRAGITPQQQVASETPTTTAPTRPWQRWGEYGWWLGDSERRYGKLHLSRNLPVKVKLEMLRDPVIALTSGYVASVLVKAKRVVECQDEGKRRFFEAMFYAWEREFLLQASMAVLLGSCALIKKFAFKVPQPKDIDEGPVWDGATTPYIVEGFDQVYPVGCNPIFDDKRRTFQGIDHLDGKVDAFYSLWLSLGQALAFGDYWGKGRLENSYKHWWIKNFGWDNYLVWMQRQINPSTQVDYPPGKDNSDTNREVAIATGNSVRAGSTVAMPSNVYETIDPMTGEKSLTGVRKWAISFLESSGDVGRFHELEDQCDRKMALGMLVPPQSFLDVKQTALGGPTTADVLMALAEEILMMDCADIDRHVNDYVFPAVAKANFAPDSPRVRVRTVGLEKENTELLHDIIGRLMQRQETDVAVFDLRGALEQERMPVVERGEVSPDGEGEGEGETAFRGQAAGEEVYYRGPDFEITDSDVKEAIREAYETNPFLGAMLEARNWETRND